MNGLSCEGRHTRRRVFDTTAQASTPHPGDRGHGGGAAGDVVFGRRGGRQPGADLQRAPRRGHRHLVDRHVRRGPGRSLDVVRPRDPLARRDPPQSPGRGGDGHPVGEGGPTRGRTPAEPLRVMPLGDSITDDYTRYDTWKGLVEAGYVVDFVGTQTSIPSSRNGEVPDVNGQPFDQDHEGHSAWAASDMLAGHPKEPDAGRLRALARTDRRGRCRAPPHRHQRHRPAPDRAGAGGGFEPAASSSSSSRPCPMPPSWSRRSRRWDPRSDREMKGAVG